MEYILFHRQNYSDTMLIPVELLIESRKVQFESLKSFSKKMNKNTYEFIIEYTQISKIFFLKKIIQYWNLLILCRHIHMEWRKIVIFH